VRGLWRPLGVSLTPDGTLASGEGAPDSSQDTADPTPLQPGHSRLRSRPVGALPRAMRGPCVECAGSPLHVESQRSARSGRARGPRFRRPCPGLARACCGADVRHRGRAPALCLGRFTGACPRRPRSGRARRRGDLRRRPPPRADRRDERSQRKDAKSGDDRDPFLAHCLAHFVGVPGGASPATGISGSKTELQNPCRRHPTGRP
jgi:hypothetical protein